MKIQSELITLSACLVFFVAGVIAEAHGMMMSALAALIFSFVFAVACAICTSVEIETEKKEADDGEE